MIKDESINEYCLSAMSIAIAFTVGKNKMTFKQFYSEENMLEFDRLT